MLLALFACVRIHAQTAAVAGVFPNTNLVKSYFIGFAQGTCNNETNTYWVGTDGMGELTSTYHGYNGGPSVDQSHILAGLSNFGPLHLGDADYYQGYIYVPMEANIGAQKGAGNIDIGIFTATNLVRCAAVSISNYQNEASAVCIDPSLSNSVALFAANWASLSTNDGIYEYSVNNLTNLTFVKVLPMSQYIVNIQGIICVGGMLYVIGDKGPSGEVYQVNPTNGVVTFLAELNIAGGAEWEGLDYFQGFLVANEGHTGTADWFDFFGVLPGSSQSITGSVVDNNNNPIAGVGVSARASINGANDQTGTVDTDTNGNYTLNVPNGNWSVAVNCSSGSDSLGSLGDYYCPDNQSVLVASNNATVNFIIQICSGVSITTPSPLPAGGSGIFYSQSLQASSCNPGFTWTLIDGSLPSGLSLSTNGTLSGTPAGPGSLFHFTVHVTDGNNATTNQTFSLNITNAVKRITGSVRDSHNKSIIGVGVTVVAVMSATNYQIITVDTDTNGNYSLTVTNANLSVAVNCNGGADSLGNLGDYACPTVQDVNLVANAATNNFIVQICTLSITTPSPLPAGEIGVFYSQSLQASSCNPGYTWTLIDGSLPSGLSLSGDGTLSGTPSGSGGVFNFTVQVTDASNSTTNQTFYLPIKNAVQIATTSLPPGSFFNMPLFASNGLPPYTWSLSPGSTHLPSNFFVSTNGVLLGSATTYGTFNFSVRVRDNLAGVADQTLTVNILQPLAISTAGRKITLVWPPSATNYVLQSATNLLSPDWETVSDAVPGTAYIVTNTVPVEYFRLTLSATNRN